MLGLLKLLSLKGHSYVTVFPLPRGYFNAYINDYFLNWRPTKYCKTKSDGPKLGRDPSLEKHWLRSILTVLLIDGG